MVDQFGDEDSKNDFGKALDSHMGKMKSKLSPGDKIQAEILSIGKDEIFVSTGTIHDGVALKSDFLKKNPEFTHKKGDVVELYVTHIKGSDIRLSPLPTSKNLAEDIEDAHDMELPIEGRVTEVVKGGFRVSIMGHKAFCPVSQMDLKYVEDSAQYVGMKFEFLVTKFEEGGRNIVVSRKKILEQEKELNRAAFFEDRKPGEVISGKVTRIEKFGAFVELAPGLEGLVHISELGWSRVAHPSEVLQVGQEVRAQILKLEGDKISLSIKEVAEDPWAQVAAKYPVGRIGEGQIQRKEAYGVFVKLGEGVVGLLPKSKISDSLTVKLEGLRVGQTLQVVVETLDLEARRVGLGLAQELEDQSWREHEIKPAKGFGSLGDQLKLAMEKKKS